MANLIPMWRDGRKICVALAEKLDSGVVLDAWERSFIAAALRVASEDGNVKRALRIGKGRGRPVKTDRDYWIYMRVEELHDVDGLTFDAAYKQVAVECSKWGEFSGRGEEAWEDVKKIHTTWRAAHRRACREAEESAE